MKNINTHFYLFSAIFLAGLSQIIIRWQMTRVGLLPTILSQKIYFFLGLLLNPWIVVAIISTLISALCWLVTLTKFELSYAYPFTSVLYLYMLLAGYFLFGDLLTVKKIMGTLVIVFGVYLVAT
ncbi:MAG: hypothetical protein LBE80_04505 [Deltaproteobacteria bacterium]|jgi:drug/metabolite transporter (DMT)-like permease|nr:hypothetical protein [Deltaproteobacteria bacterium]